jgi:hypothetical protein
MSHLHPWLGCRPLVAVSIRRRFALSCQPANADMASFGHSPHSTHLDVILCCARACTCEDTIEWSDAALNTATPNVSSPVLFHRTPYCWELLRRTCLYSVLHADHTSFRMGHVVDEMPPCYLNVHRENHGVRCRGAPCEYSSSVLKVRYQNKVARVNLSNFSVN